MKSTKLTSAALSRALRKRKISLEPGSVRCWWTRGAPHTLAGFARFYAKTRARCAPAIRTETDAEFWIRAAAELTR